MGTVAYLKYQGYECQEVMFEDGNCRWTFFATESLLEALDDFVTGQARVEPKSYNASFAAVKRELHGALGER
jgi:hypothetical protein